MFRKLFLSFAGALIVFASGAQTGVFSYINDEAKFQLISFPAQQSAALSWQIGEKAGLNLLQAIENEDGELIYTRQDGQKMLSGRTDGNIFNGIFSYEGMSIEVSLGKSIPAILTDWHYLQAEGSYRHKNDRGTGAIIELNYFFPKEPNHKLLPILASFYSLDDKHDRAETMIQTDVDNFLERYRQMSTNADGQTLEMNWIKSATGFPAFISDDLLCMVKTSAVNTGSTSVRRHSEYLVIDLKTNKKLGYTDIFDDNSIETLKAMLHESLRVSFGLEPGSSLRDAGFFSETVMPNDNMVIGAGAVGFAYNVYELGPPSKGQPMLMLPFTAIEHLLQPEFKLRLEDALRKL